MGRYEDFWQVTQDGLVFACRSLGLAVSQDQIEHLMQAYLRLSPFPEIAAALSLSRCPVRSSPMVRRRCWTALSETPVWRADSGTSSAWTKFASTSRTRLSISWQKPISASGVRNRIRLSNGWDVAGGKAFGFQAYWLNRQNAPLEVLGVEPDRVIHSAMDLVEARNHNDTGAGRSSQEARV